MIASLRGMLAAKSASAIVVECNGVGYTVAVPLTVAEKLPPPGDEIFILTEMVVRQESQTLYGFLDELSRELFRRLIRVSGIGAKIALAIMSTWATDELLTVLAAEDIGRLSMTPGIGKKTAERIVVDFKGSPLLSGISEKQTADNEVEQALATLGYRRPEIRAALKAVTETENIAAADTATRVRTALKFLAKR